MESNTGIPNDMQCSNKLNTGIPKDNKNLSKIYPTYESNTGIPNDMQCSNKLNTLMTCNPQL